MVSRRTQIQNRSPEKGFKENAAPVTETTALSHLILGHYRSREPDYIDLIDINQPIVNILTKTALHAGNEITVLVILLEHIARAEGNLLNQTILNLSLPVLWPLESCQIP